jgi:hypothetical protein
LSWNITGSVTFTVTNTAGPNAVVSGVFFDPVSGAEPTVSLSWPAFTGATGYVILRSSSATGPFTQVGTSSSTSYIDTVGHGQTYYYQIIPMVVVQ